MKEQVAAKQEMILPLESEEMAPSARPRLAVYGGTFDPVHVGHLFLAGEVVRNGFADEVLFVPALIPPHKQTRQPTSAEHRLAMLQRALSIHDCFSVSDIELQRQGPSYTIYTLETLRQTFPEHQILFLIGMDSLLELHTWHRANELVQHFRFLIFPRPNVRLPSFAELSSFFGNRDARKLLDSIVATRLIDVSATEIRECCREGTTLAGMVTDAVYEYIVEHGLYLG